jgi:hypothetical protein
MLLKNNKKRLTKRQFCGIMEGWLWGGVASEGALTKRQKYDRMEGYRIIDKTIVYCL